MPLYNADRILVRCPNWIGDMVAATPVLRCLRSNYPAARITLLLDRYVRGVIDNCPWFDDVIELDRKRGWSEMFRAAGLIRKKQIDLALLLTHSFSSALMVRIGGARKRVGHARNGRSFLLTDAVEWPGAAPDPTLVPKVTVYSSLLKYLQCENADDMRPQVFTSAADEARCEELLSLHGRNPARLLLAIVPGAAYGAAKLWPTERFAAVADELSRSRGMQPMILAGPGEASIASEIARQMKQPVLLFGEGEVSFGALKALVRRASLMLCNDTGPRHLAIAWEVPVIVLMGPTDPVVTHSDYPKTRILRQQVPCGPCYKRRCPTDHRCMTSITPEMVIQAAEKLLSTT